MITDDVTRVNIAALVLFTTTPTDRALDGWGCAGWLGEVRGELGQAARQADLPVWAACASPRRREAV